MYAIIRSGGKQYRVQAGDCLRVEKIDQKIGSHLTISEVLFVGGEKVYLGAPYISGAKVSTVVTQHDLGPKILIFKKKRRKGFRKLNGHRQPFTELFVESITSPDGNVVKAETAPLVIDPEKIALKKAEYAAKKEAELKGLSAAERASSNAQKAVKGAKKVMKKAAAGKSKKGGKKKAAGKKSGKKSGAAKAKKVAKKK